MKKYILWLCLVGMVGSAFAQNLKPMVNTDSVHNAFNQQMNDIFQNVDLTQVPSGILYERGMGYIDISAYNGQLTDKSETLPIAFGLAYASMKSMTVNAESLFPDPSGYRNILDNQTPQSDSFLVAGIHAEYDRLDSLSVQNNLLFIQNDVLHDVPNRPSSPFITDNLFLFAPNVSQINSNALTLYFDQNQFYTNTNKTISSLEVDMDNGRGYDKGAFERSVRAEYDQPGKKHIKLKLTYTDGSVYYSHFKIYTKGASNDRSGDLPPQPADITKYLTPYSGASAESGRGGGHIYTFLACGHTEITKPFIWAEAYNPTVGNIDLNLTKESILDRMSRSETEINGERLEEYLLENGYDIIVLDYDDGGDYLPRNAEFIKDAIRWVNTQKHASNSNEKNILLGQSMGGVCSMYALKRMEVQTVEDHEVETFIIFDSPINGVNVPLSAQGGLLAIAGMDVNVPFSSNGGPLRDYVSILDNAVDLLNKPATRTMVKFMIDESHQYMEPHLFQDFYDYLHNTLGGMPTDCDVVVMTNGSNKGQQGEHNFVPGEKIVQSNTSAISIITNMIGQYINGTDTSYIGNIELTPNILQAGAMIIWAVSEDITTDIRLYALTDSAAGMVFFCNIVIDMPFLIPDVVNHYEYYNTTSTSTIPALDNAPGGFIGFQNNPIILPTNVSAAIAPDDFKMNTWCFTPSMSVLNYRKSYTDTRFHELDHNFENVTTNLQSGDCVGVDNYLSNSSSISNSAGVFQNTAHTWFTNEQTGYMRYIMVGDDLLGNISYLGNGDSYNYGKLSITPYHVYNHDPSTSSLVLRTNGILDHDLEVENTILGVNIDDNIGLTTPTNNNSLGLTPTISSFTMQLGNSCTQDDPITLRIEDGGELIIGDTPTRTGMVIVNDGHRIVVESGGTIIINENSSLHLNGDANLILKDGANLINHGVLTLNGTSKVIYEANVNFVMDKAESAFVFNGGHVYLQENAIFTFTHANSTQAGHVIVQENAHFYGDEPNCQVEIFGKGPNNFIMKINEGKVLEFEDPDNLIFVDFNRGKFKFDGDAEIRVPCEFEGYRIKMENIGSVNKSTLKLLDNSYIAISDFNDVKVKANFANDESVKLLKMNLVDFNFSSTSIYSVVDINGGQYELNYCDFELPLVGNSRGVVATNSISNSQVKGCDFIGGNIALMDLSFNTLILKSNLFDNNKSAFVRKNGLAELRCNTFEDNEIPIIATNNSTLLLGVYHQNGYNVFTNSDNESIRINYGVLPDTKEGYNKFFKGSSNLFFEGTTIQDIYGGTAFGNATKNAWFSTPSQSNFDVNLHIPGVNVLIPVTYDFSYPTEAYCGQYTPYVPKPLGPVEYNDHEFGISGLNGGNPQTGSQWLVMAMSYKESFDSLAGDNFIALDILHKLALNDYSITNMSESEINNYAMAIAFEMKSTIGEMISAGQIDIQQNTTSFSVPIQKYIDALNVKSAIMQSAPQHQNKNRLIHEMDKSLLFASLGHYQKALSILYNAEYCGLDSLDQTVLNELKFNMEETKAKLNAGYKAFYMDSVFTDTSNYNVPSGSGSVLYTFGSMVNGISSINYTNNCSPQTYKAEFKTSNNFNIFPNPTNQYLTFKYQVGLKDNASVTIFNLDGKLVFKKVLQSDINQETINVQNLATGMYFYKYEINNSVINSGKFTKM